MICIRRSGRAVECTGLENQHTAKKGHFFNLLFPKKNSLINSFEKIEVNDKTVVLILFFLSFRLEKR